jgi:hypothetical protein
LQFDQVGWGSGHVYRVDRRQGPIWYAKYRLPDGRQVKKKIGPAWTGRGRPRVGYFTRRGAEEWLRETLDDVRERAYAGARRTDATFAEAAREWLRYVEHDRACKPSTLRSYRSTLEAHLLPAFGPLPLHEITRAHRALALPPHRLAPYQEQAADRALRRLPARAEGLRPRTQPGRAGGEAAPAPPA